MERYTEKHYDGNGYYLICSGNCETLNCGDCGILDKIVDRLAAYEDTGLEPEEIGALKSREKGLVELLNGVSCGCAVTYTHIPASANWPGRIRMGSSQSTP